MSSLGAVIGKDKMDLCDAGSIALAFFIENDHDISRVADCFCCGDRITAFKDIMQKGLQGFLDMCDLDEHLSEEMENMKEMQNAPPGKGGSL